MQDSNSQLKESTKIKYFKGGPYLIEGTCVLVDGEGNETVKEGKVFLCRCGQSANKPFCDGAHKKNEFGK
ncbi:MAG: CDGSH iron-sulfur domain-containing protein [Ignavibacteriaceae bacterium]|nr:CDGSH iron-sulfur domain-containing protein [Ignavibacteriaceae bacterium]